ncbi:MAG: hypothetical protein GAK43_02488 [Stenotrophomonas maltophilia]|nr:MAG: hypothetical protein GAK43_02488 [Stenotrophomonas maltophilia]
MKVTADDRVQRALLAQKHRATERAEEVAGGIEDGLGNEHHETPGQGGIRRAYLRVPILQGGLDALGTQRAAHDFNRIRVDLQHLALGIGDHDGIEIRILRLQANGLFAQPRRIAPMLAQLAGTEAQAALRGVQELANAGSDLGGIGTVGGQRMLDQCIALDDIGRDHAVGQGGQHRNQYQPENQRAQIQYPARALLHRSFPVLMRLLSSLGCDQGRWR